jgi:hypothetical protein
MRFFLKYFALLLLSLAVLTWLIPALWPALSRFRGAAFQQRHPHGTFHHY